MAGATPLERVLRRDRAIVLVALTGLTLLAWGYMAYEAWAMYRTGVCSCAGLKMSGPDLAPWSAWTLLPLFLMWAEMMVAMMIPTAAPMILTFAAVNRKRREQQGPYVPAGLFLLGYVIIWTGFSTFAAFGQWVLHGKALLSPMMVSTSPVFGGGLLIATGVFQWLPLKRSCLAHCRSPLGFIVTDWREGRAGALVMGLKHGAYCTGCCWLLMSLLFVAGVMNLWWIASISGLVLVEKVTRHGLHVARIAGVVMILWGGWLLQKTA